MTIYNIFLKHVHMYKQVLQGVKNPHQFVISNGQTDRKVIGKGCFAPPQYTDP